MPAAIAAEIKKCQVSDPVGNKFRSIDLGGLEPDNVMVLKWVLHSLPARVNQAGGWKLFYDRIRSRLKNISARAKIYPAISFSTARHIAISAIKKQRGPVIAAALAAHASSLSCVAGYKRASSKCVKISPAHKLEPSPVTLKSVRHSLKALHPRVRNQIIEKPAITPRQ